MTVAVGVHVVGGQQSFVDFVVAVVVDPIADFVGIGADGGDGVIAVIVVFHVVRGHLAGFRGPVGITVAIVVEISVVGDAQTLVDFVITVVVQPVADLLLVGIHLRSGVVAVVAVLDVAGDVAAGLSHDVGVAVAILVRVPVSTTVEPLVDFIVAVVVHLVADLVCVWVDRCVLVVAVPLGHSEPIVVAIIENGCAPYRLFREIYFIGFAVIDLHAHCAGLVLDTDGMGA